MNSNNEMKTQQQLQNDDDEKEVEEVKQAMHLA